MSDTPRTDAKWGEQSPVEFGWQVTAWEIRDFARQLERELSATQAKLAQADEKRKEDIRLIEQTALQLRDEADRTAPMTIESIRNLEHLMGQSWAYNLFAKKLRAAFPDVFKEGDR